MNTAEETLRESILTHYGIELTQIVPIADGHMNDNFFINEHLVLKLYADAIDSGSLERAHAHDSVLETITSIATPKLITQRDASTLAFLPDGKRYALFERIEGYATFDYAEKNIISTARALALLHADMERHRDALTPWGNSQSIYQCGDMFALIAQGLSKHELDGEAIRDSLQRVAAFHQSDACKCLLRIPIHGDYAGDNILFHRDTHEVEAVLDFEESRIDSPLYDLVFLHFILSEESPELAELFVTSYVDHSREDLKHALRKEMNYFYDILLSMLVYELYLMIKWDKADGIIEAYEMLVRAGSPALHMGR